MAIKFDFYNNAGEGATRPACIPMAPLPRIPAIDLSATGINLHSGDIFNVQMTYNGTTLTVVITDTVTNASATQTYTVNIPRSSAARLPMRIHWRQRWATAIQEILNWT